MATITLQDYYDKLEELLTRNANDEVIRHCRHILQFFPKNARVFRSLGRALLESGEYEEAGEIFRRLLGVYPDDYTAHVGLGEVYQKLNKPDDALWHLERAYEQDPNNQMLIDTLRELYQRYRKIEQAKLQLTAAAVARQYVRNELYGQAIDVLAQAIERAPERMDLRVLLAQTLWDANQRVEAAERALDVLDKLPDCLVANRILTQLWLDEQRPSDAQRFLTHIESVEPYMALELAKGEASDSDLTLEELDYSRIAQQELAMASPDWLQDLGDLGEPTLEDEPAYHELPADPTQPVPPSDEDWLRTLSEASQEKTVNLTKDDLLAAKKAAAERAKAAGMDSEQDWMSEMEETAKKPTSSLEGLFDDLPANTTNTQGFTDFLDTLATAPTERPAPAETGDEEDALDWLQQDDDKPLAASDTHDPLAWMRSSGIEFDESATADDDSDPFGAEQEMKFRAPDTSNPLAWLQGEDAETPAETDNNDPLAWMRDAGVEVVDETPTATPVVKPTVPPPAAKPAAQNVSDDAFLEEMLSMEQLSSTGSWELPAVSSEQPADDELPDLFADMPDEVPAASSEDMPDWISGADMAEPPSAEESPAEDDALAWLNQPSSDEEPEEEPIAQSDAPDWLTGQGFADETPEEVPVAEEDALAWMNQPSTEEEPEEEPIAQSDAPDWLTGQGFADETPEEVPVAEEDPLAWMNQPSAEEEPEEEPIAQSDAPDWLTGQGFADETPQEEPVAEEDPLAWMNQPSSDEEPEEEPIAQSDTPDWLTEQGFADETPEEEPVAEEDPLAWMNQPSADEEPEAEPIAEEDPMAWMHDMPVEETIPEEDGVAQSDMPDWLAAAHDEMAQQPEPAAEEEQDLAWMTEEEQPEPAAVTPTEAELPGEVTPIAEGQNAMSDEQQPAEEIIIKAQAAEGEALPLAEAHDEEFILGPVPPETLAEIQAQAAPLEGAVEPVTPLPLDSLDVVAAVPADDLPDLLVSPADATPAQAAPAEIAAEETSLGWMDQGDAAPVAEAVPTDAAQAPDWLSVSDEVEQQAAAEAVIPDWLSSYGEPGTTAVEEEPAAEADVPDWMGGVSFGDEEAAVEEEPAAEADVPDWMGGVSFGDEEAAVEEEPVAEADVPDWMGGVSFEEEAVEEEPAAEADVPDWMGGVSFEEEAVEEEPVAEADVPDWMGGVSFGEEETVEEEPVAEAETPDWMSDMSFEEETVEEEPVAEAETPDWMSDMSFEEEAVEEEPAAEADVPDWMGGVSFGEEETVEEEPVAEADVPDWMGGVSFGEEETVEEEPVAEAETPDWMSDMSFEEEAVEEEPVAEADVPDWMGGVSFGEEETVEEEPVAEAETPDWMSDMSFEEEAAEEEPAAEAETPDWLSEMSYETAEEAQPEVASVEEDEEALDWMAELEEAASPSTPDQGTGFDWMEPAEEGDAPIIAQGNTDWLTSVGISKQSTPAASTDFGDSLDWAQNAETDTSSDMPGWLQEAQPADASASEFDWANDLIDDTPTKPTMAGVEDFVPAGEELIPAPAENAPDWLNAMVPGLDVDPDAEESEPIEQEFVAEASGHRPRTADETGTPDRREFEWLTDIVDEETSAQPAAAPVVMPEQLPAAPEPKAPRMPRFSFSRLPAWLRRKSEAPAPATAPAAAPVINNEEPEWLRDAEDTGDNSIDNDDVDLPDWLK